MPIAKVLPRHCQSIAKALPSPCDITRPLRSPCQAVFKTWPDKPLPSPALHSQCLSQCLCQGNANFFGIAKLFSKKWNVALLNNSKPLTRHGQAIFDREQYHPNCWLHLALEFCLNAILINYHANIYDTFSLILRSKLFTLRTHHNCTLKKSTFHSQHILIYCLGMNNIILLII